jgi:hypothetical protein
MTNTKPRIGRIAIVQVSGTTVAYAQGYDVKETGKAVTEYSLTPSGTSGDWPSVGFSGNKTGTVTIDALYVDNTYITMFEANATVSIICGPAGSSGGNPKDTYSTIITSVQTTVKHPSITVLKITADIIAAPTHSTW